MRRVNALELVPVGFLACAALLACGEDDFVIPEPIVLVDLRSGDCSSIKTGETCQLEVRVIDAMGEPVTDVQLFWSSLNQIFATVTFEGEVTAVRAGQATIVAALPNTSLADSIQLTITDPPEPPEPI